MAFPYRNVDSQYMGRHRATSTHATRRAPAELVRLPTSDMSAQTPSDVESADSTWNAMNARSPKARRKP